MRIYFKPLSAQKRCCYFMCRLAVQPHSVKSIFDQQRELNTVILVAMQIPHGFYLGIKEMQKIQRFSYWSKILRVFVAHATNVSRNAEVYHVAWTVGPVLPLN